MILIAGLGNPGKEYENTRHNYGFMVIDELAKRNGFPEFKLAKEHNALISLQGNIILAKPQTFMNASGKAVKSIANYYKMPVKNIVIIHDDADVDLGDMKIAEGRGSAGHNGVQSIIDELSTNEFNRVRLGTNSNDPSFKEPVERGEGLESIVLKNFSKDEQDTVSQTIKKAAEKIEESWMK